MCRKENAVNVAVSTPTHGPFTIALLALYVENIKPVVLARAETAAHQVSIAELKGKGMGHIVIVR